MVSSGWIKSSSVSIDRTAAAVPYQKQSGEGLLSFPERKFAVVVAISQSASGVSTYTCIWKLVYLLAYRNKTTSSQIRNTSIRQDALIYSVTTPRKATGCGLGISKASPNRHASSKKGWEVWQRSSNSKFCKERDGDAAAINWVNCEEFCLPQEISSGKIDVDCRQ